MWFSGKSATTTRERNPADRPVMRTGAVLLAYRWARCVSVGSSS